MDIEQEVKEFINAVTEEVGILAARGSMYYGFLHLSFQEYLSARWLIRFSTKISERILEKAYEPRWREPIILSIGYFSFIDKSQEKPENKRAFERF